MVFHPRPHHLPESNPVPIRAAIPLGIWFESGFFYARRKMLMLRFGAGSMERYGWLCPDGPFDTFPGNRDEISGAVLFSRQGAVRAVG